MMNRLNKKPIAAQSHADAQSKVPNRPKTELDKRMFGMLSGTLQNATAVQPRPESEQGPKVHPWRPEEVPIRPKPELDIGRELLSGSKRTISAFSAVQPRPKVDDQEQRLIAAEAAKLYKIVMGTPQTSAEFLPDAVTRAILEGYEPVGTPFKYTLIGFPDEELWGQAVYKKKTVSQGGKKNKNTIKNKKNKN